jgi:hypothetical protein
LGPNAHSGSPRHALTTGSVAIRGQREWRVLGQQGEDRVYLTAPKGVGEALGALAQPPVAEDTQARLPAFVRQSLLDRSTGGRTRLRQPAITSRQTLVAIRYSHVRAERRPRNGAVESS